MSESSRSASADQAGAQCDLERRLQGQFCMGDPRLCYPLTVQDGQSRFLLECRGMHSLDSKPRPPEYLGRFELRRVSGDATLR